MDEHGAYSRAGSVQFTTYGYEENHRPRRPSLSVAGGTSNTTLVPVLKASGFSDPDPNDVVSGTWWGIREGTSGKYFWPETGGKWFPGEVSSIVVPEGVLEFGKTYQAAVAYKDSYGAFSYGGFVTFTTASHYEPYEPNNKIEEATLLTPSKKQNHTIKPVNDLDIFKFDLKFLTYFLLLKFCITF